MGIGLGLGIGLVVELGLGRVVRFHQIQHGYWLSTTVDYL